MVQRTFASKGAFSYFAIGVGSIVNICSGIAIILLLIIAVIVEVDDLFCGRVVTDLYV